MNPNPSKEDLYDLCIRSYKFVPPYSDPLCSKKFLRAALKGVVPDARNVPAIELSPKATPLKKDLHMHVLETIAFIAQANSDPELALLYEMLQSKLPDTTWMIRLLYYLDKEHYIFDPRYLEPSRKTKADEDIMSELKYKSKVCAIEE